jgi:putative endonuclease
MNIPSHLPLPRHLQRGRRAEILACRYLERQGLSLIKRNFHCKCGEIDLIMREANSLVFVEVRYRSSQQFGTAVETILPDKMQRLRRSAEFFLQQHTRFDELYSRFDVIGITGTLEGPEVHWIRDAF